MQLLQPEAARGFIETIRRGGSRYVKDSHYVLVLRCFGQRAKWKVCPGDPLFCPAQAFTALTRLWCHHQGCAETWELMEADGHAPDLKSLQTAVRAYSELGDTVKAQQLLDFLLDLADRLRVRPLAYAFESVLDAYHKVRCKMSRPILA
jgi:hypothetical protein